MNNLLGIASTASAFSALSILKTLSKRKYQVAALWILGTGAVAGIVYQMKPVYQAETLIQVEPQKIPENFVAATVQVMLEARLDVLKQQALSRDRLWGLITEMNLYPKERQQLTQQEVLQKMKEDDVTITLERSWSANRPGAFRVSYRGNDPRVVAQVTDRIGRFFIDENLRQRESEAEGAAGFLRTQTEESANRLREQEAKLSAFKITHNGELPNQEAGLVAEMAQARTEMAGLQESLARAEQNKVLLENNLTLMKDSAARRREVDQLRSSQNRRALVSAAERGGVEPPPTRSELDRARSELASARGRYLDGHPEVQSAKRRVEQLERQEAAAQEQLAKMPKSPAARPTEAGPTGDTDLELRSIESNSQIEEFGQRILTAQQEIETLKSRRTRILAQIETIKERIRRIPANEAALASINRDYDTSNKNYQSLLTKKLDADTATSMEKEQKSQKLVMLERAKTPEKPIRPRRAILIGGGAVAMLLISLSLAILLELKRNVVLGEWELPPGTVVLGRIPVLKVRESRT